MIKAEVDFRRIVVQTDVGKITRGVGCGLNLGHVSCCVHTCDPILAYLSLLVFLAFLGRRSCGSRPIITHIPIRIIGPVQMAYPVSLFFLFPFLFLLFFLPFFLFLFGLFALLTLLSRIPRIPVVTTSAIISCASISIVASTSSSTIILVASFATFAVSFPTLIVPLGCVRLLFLLFVFFLVNYLTDI